MSEFSHQDIFASIAKSNHWGSEESVSGPGSTLGATAQLRLELVQTFELLKVQSIVDAPCGDMNWMRHVNYPFTKYIGVDIVPSIIEMLKQQTFPASYHFQVGNIVTDILPEADVLLCRDCLVHLPFKDILEAKRLLKMAGLRYVFATTFPEISVNQDCGIGDWRMLNLQAAPFYWGEPLRILQELPDSTGICSSKSIGVWAL